MFCIWMWQTRCNTVSSRFASTCLDWYRSIKHFILDSFDCYFLTTMLLDYSKIRVIFTSIIISQFSYFYAVATEEYVIIHHRLMLKNIMLSPLAATTECSGSRSRKLPILQGQKHKTRFPVTWQPLIPNVVVIRFILNMRNRRRETDATDKVLQQYAIYTIYNLLQESSIRKNLSSCII